MELKLRFLLLLLTGRKIDFHMQILNISFIIRFLQLLCYDELFYLWCTISHSMIHGQWLRESINIFLIWIFFYPIKFEYGPNVFWFKISSIILNWFSIHHIVYESTLLHNNLSNKVKIDLIWLLLNNLHMEELSDVYIHYESKLLYWWSEFDPKQKHKIKFSSKFSITVSFHLNVWF